MSTYLFVLFHIILFFFFYVFSKHGCDYKGYGLASRLPRLDLSAFAKERLEDRRRPIVQQFCVVCQSPENLNKNRLIPCKGGCSRAYHQYCYSPSASTEEMNDLLWCCNSSCCENGQRNKVCKCFALNIYLYIFINIYSF